MAEHFCDFCDSTVSIVHNTEMGFPTKTANLCTVCFSSFCGNMYFYPEQYSAGEKNAAKIMSQHTNLILKAIASSSN